MVAKKIPTEITARITEISRAIQSAEGLLGGLAADSTINSAELKVLKNWLQSNTHLQDVVPFSEVHCVLERISNDQEVGRSDLTDLLDFCRTFKAENGPISILTKEMRVLHGLLQGVAADGTINVAETNYIRDWLRSHSFDAKRWPYKELWELTSRVLKDGKISKTEQAELLKFCSDFIPVEATDAKRDETILDPHKSFLQNSAPIVNTIQSIVDENSTVSIPERTFCFTGQMRAGKRKDIQSELLNAGGKPMEGISLALNYLVIGANSNPCWAYATYGRKIEEVMRNRENGARTIFLHEDRFIKVLRA